MDGTEYDASIGAANKKLHDDLIGIIEAQVSALEAIAAEQQRLKAEVIASTTFAIVATTTSAVGLVMGDAVIFTLGIYIAFATVWLAKLARPFVARNIVVIDEDYEEEGATNDD